jgi:hypothetical protein
MHIKFLSTNRNINVLIKIVLCPDAIIFMEKWVENGRRSG